MAQRVVIHIGLMKSGTTFLQGRLNANREQLAEQDVLFPGPTWRRHVNAVADFMGAKDRQPGSWESLREEINDYPGTAVISMEYLAMLGPRKIARLAESFDTPDLRIVVGVRDLGRTVPAMWQEVVKNRQTWTWAEYVESIRTDGESGRRFWRQQHSGRIVTRWANSLGTRAGVRRDPAAAGRPERDAVEPVLRGRGHRVRALARGAAVQRVAGGGVGARGPRAQPAHLGPDAPGLQAPRQGRRQVPDARTPAPGGRDRIRGPRLAAPGVRGHPRPDRSARARTSSATSTS